MGLFSNLVKLAGNKMAEYSAKIQEAYEETEYWTDEKLIRMIKCSNGARRLGYMKAAKERGLIGDNKD